MTDIQDIKVVSQTTANIQHTADSIGPYVTGIAVLPNGGLLLADDVHYSLVLLDHSLAVKETLNVTRGHEIVRKPYDVALVDESEAIVTYPGPRLLQFVSLVPHLKCGKTISLDKNLWCVGVVTRKIYVTCPWGEKSEIIILDMRGEVQQIVDIMKINPDFGHVRYITGNQAGTKLYLSCPDRLVCITTDGQFLYSLCSPALERAAGVTIDEDDNVYVCCGKSNQVLVVSSKCSAFKILTVFDKLRWPKSIGYRPSERALVVGGFSQDLTVLKIG